MATINSVSRRFGVLLGCLWGVWAGEAAVFQSGVSFVGATGMSVFIR